MNKMPLISIVLPVYNIEKYIKETLESVSNQIYRHWECIIINDGSTDNTEHIVKNFIEKDKKNEGKYRLYSEENRGPSQSRNLGIDKARGEYIAFLDSDDLWMPHHLSFLWDKMTETKADLVFSNAYEIKENLYTTIPRNDDTLSGFLEGKRAIELFLKYNRIQLPLVLCKKEILTQVGGFTFNKNAEDLYLWLELLFNGNRFFCSDEITGYIRKRSFSISSRDSLCCREVLEVIHLMEDKIKDKNIDYNKYFHIWIGHYFNRNIIDSYIQKVKYIASIDGGLFHILRYYIVENYRELKKIYWILREKI